MSAQEGKGTALGSGFMEMQVLEWNFKLRRIMTMRKFFPAVFLLTAFFIGCGHSQSSKVGLISFGSLESKVIPDNVEGKIVAGKDCGGSQLLSNATRDALKGTDCDTLIDAEVINTTGIFVWSNCLEVKGKAINSSKLQNGGLQ